MSREDRRPLAPVPEDSVDTYMHPFPSYPIPESSTLYPPYNIFHTFYYPSANASLDTNLAPVDWDHYQPTYAPDLLCAVGAEYPDFPAIMQSQELLHHKSVPHPAHSLLFMPASPGNQGQVYYAHHPTPMPAGAQDLLCASGTEYLDFTARMRSREPFHAPVPHPAQSLSFLPDPVPEYQAPVHDPDLSAPACEWDTIVNMVDDFFANTEYCDFYAAGAMPAPEVVMPSPRVSALYEDSGAYLANDFIATTEYCQHATPAPELVPTSASYEGTGAYMANDFFADTECDFFEVVAPSSPRSTGASPRKRRILKPRPRNPPPPRTSGFIPSDPDDISPHEKKRLYLQCLENYVMYLHSLFARINVAPLPLERVSNYRITSRSMRVYFYSPLHRASF
ncbi:hypothetical protein DFH07DRAFT_207692 [Mycena maculata]|uniref:Uncharacterized protein n=1 Tax=Mycena maculata TaxID=230809 RepID=A0AAD7P1C9_9AGAR|nr:hypothetical protein DFH07DRAFT_207692 [Mycena maculata]